MLAAISLPGTAWRSRRGAGALGLFASIGPSPFLRLIWGRNLIRWRNCRAGRVAEVLRCFVFLLAMPLCLAASRSFPREVVLGRQPLDRQR